MFTQQVALLQKIEEAKHHRVRRGELYWMVRKLVSYDDRTNDLIQDLTREERPEPGKRRKRA